MALLSAAMLAELQKRWPEVYPLLEVTFPGGTKRVSSSSVASSSQGLYEGIVLRWDTLRRGVAERTCGLESVEFAVDVADHDRYFSNLIAGANGHGIRGAAFTLKLASPNVPQADWFTLFAGVLAGYEQIRPLVWTWTFRPNDLALMRPFPKTAIGLGDWPNASREARGLYPNLIYGKVSSNGDGGAVACPLVDISGCRYMVSAGWAKTILAVFIDGAPYTGSNPTSRVVVNGRRYTLLDFPTMPVESVITADVEGYETVGDGSGSLISNPADQLKHLLVNWVWGDYKTGAWLADSTAPVDTTLFAAAASFLTARGHKGAIVAGGRAEAQTGLSALEAWCQSFQAQPFWRNNGQLAVRIGDPAAAAYPTATLDADPDILNFGSMQYDAEDLVDRVDVRYLFDPVEDQFTQALEVRDPSLARDLSDTLELHWSHAAEVA